MGNRICYCSGHSEEDVTKDAMEHKGRSLIMGKILTKKKDGVCSCGDNHPLGR